MTTTRGWVEAGCAAMQRSVLESLASWENTAGKPPLMAKSTKNWLVRGDDRLRRFTNDDDLKKNGITDCRIAVVDVSPTLLGDAISTASNRSCSSYGYAGRVPSKRRTTRTSSCTRSHA